MEKKVISGIMLTLLLTCMLTLAFNIQQVKSEPTTIIVPDNYPTIQEAINNAYAGDTIYVRNGTYYENVVVNKSVSLIGEDRQLTIIDGTTSENVTIYVSVDNVAISGFTIQNLFHRTVFLNHSSGSNVKGNIVSSHLGIEVRRGSSNTIIDNKFIGPVIDNETYCIFIGIWLANSNGNVIFGNWFTSSSHTAIGLRESSHNHIIYNDIAGHFSPYIVYLRDSSENWIIGNTIRQGWVGSISFHNSSDNFIYHNNFKALPEDFVDISLDHLSMNNTWNDGYPSGGNYWSDYYGTDLYSGPYQNMTGSDGIGDTPYVIDGNNQDNYPLMNPWSPIVHDVAVVDVFPSAPGVYVGMLVNVSVTIGNKGDFAEDLDVTAYYNTTAIEAKTVTNLAPSAETTLTFTWNTSGISPGSYTISAEASIVPGETDTTDNTMTSSIKVKVKMVGDINGDNKIDIRDLAQTALAFGSYASHPRWNILADINQDNKVDIRDLALIARNFGKTYP